MEFTEEERKELEEKYKEQRRAMWTGSRPSNTEQEKRLEKVTEDSDSIELPSQDLDSHRTRTEPLFENQRTRIPSQAISNQSMQARLNAKDTARKDKGNTVPATDYSDTQQMIQKIRRQREDIWEGNSATRPRQRQRWRASSGKAGKFWKPSQLEDEKKPRRWKLALGVFGTIIVLVCVGVMLGYWFAS